MKKVILTAIALSLGFIIQSTYALDRDVMGSNPEVQYGCQDIVHEGITSKICYKHVSEPKIKELLPSTSWSIVSFNGTKITSTGTLSFSNRTFSAKLCNSLSGKYSVLDKTFILRNVVSTRMYCEGDSMGVENALAQATITKISLDGDILTIRTRHDTIIWKRK